MERDTLGWRIEQARRRAGMTQRDLEERIGRSRQTISDYEQDVSVPPADVLLAISEATNVPLHELMGEQQPSTMPGGLLGLLSGGQMACPHCGKPIQLGLVCSEAKPKAEDEE